MKSSAQRGIRKQILETYPKMTEELLEVIMPKKANMQQTKCREHITFICVDGEPLFYQHFDGPLMPSLRVIHKCKNSHPPLVFSFVVIDGSSPIYEFCSSR